MITKPLSEVDPAELFDAVRTHVDGDSITIYYPDDALPELPAPTAAEAQQVLMAPYVDAVQASLDAGARAHGYDGILSMVSYEGDPNTGFAADGAAAKAWRSACWAHCYSVMGAVESGQAALPTVDELLAGLPPLGV